MSKLDTVLDTIDRNQPAALRRLTDLIAIRSVSTDPAYASECRRAAEWLSAELSGLGFEMAIRQTPGHPLVVGHAKSAARDVPHVLFYGHYDVQPPDPIELWEGDPFVARVAAGRIVGRGAADDKGQLMTFVEACRAWRENGGYPCNISVLFEGEEETGSPSLPSFLTDNGADVAADLMLVCDTGMWDKTTPAITVMLRGLLLEEVIIQGASRDLHSGLFGGAAVNPIHVLARVVADLRDAQGRITIPGFYDGVEELPPDVSEQWRALDFDEAAFLGDVGLSEPAGEK